MDSNVSKNTNSHNFFKIAGDRQKLGISVKNLLKQELLLILDLYQQKFSVEIEHKLAANILEAKIFLTSYKEQSLNTVKNVKLVEVTEQSVPVSYSCPIGFCLGKILQSDPAVIARRLQEIGASIAKIEDVELGIWVEIVASGWINFQLDDRSTALWLDRLLKEKRSPQSNPQPTSSHSSKNIFPIQYIHARCCSLLRLAAREKLVLSTGLQIDWRDSLGNLWLVEPAELILLQQLLKITDSWTAENDDRQWAKLSLNLSEATANFLADCRFLGEIKEQHPQKAIARLGLISLVQFWLRRILLEKLGTAAPESM